MRRMIAAALAALAAGAGLSPAHALALRNAAANVSVNGLAPGRECRLSACAATKLSLLNTGGEPAAVALSVATPDPRDLADGYEPAPSASWVRLEAGRWTLAPGASGETDAVVKVPGGGVKPGQYQLDWLALGKSPSGLALKLRSRLLLRVEDGDEEAWRRERESARRRPETELRLLGGKDAARGAAVGRRVALKELGAVVKAANLGERDQLVRVRTGAPRPEDVPQGYEACPNPDFLRAPRRVRAAAGKVQELELTLDVPDQARYRGRKWAFQVEAQALESAQDEPEKAVILVETEGKAAR